MPLTKYIWDVESDNVLMEADENDVTTAVYNHEPGEHGELISQRRDGKTSCYQYGETGSTRSLTDEAGDTTDTYTYSAFGETIAKTGTTTNPFRFAGAYGYYFDEETDDYYVRARTYKPTIARFTSTDPILFFDGMNLYAYVSNNPVNLIDPSGLQAKKKGKGNAINKGKVKTFPNCGRPQSIKDLPPLFPFCAVKGATFLFTRTGCPCWTTKRFRFPLGRVCNVYMTLPCRGTITKTCTYECVLDFKDVGSAKLPLPTWQLTGCVNDTKCKC